MNLTVNRAALAAALRTCAGVAEAKSPQPLLSMVRLTAKGKSLRCAATDLNLYVTVDVPCSGTGGDVLVPAAALSKAIDVLPGDEVSLAVDGSSLVARTGKIKQLVPVNRNGSDHPKAPVVDGEWQSMPTASLEAVLAGCLPAVSGDDSRFHICGVHVFAERGVMVGQSTDGHRGHVMRRSCDAEIPAGTIPTRGCERILPMLDGIEEVDIACTEHHRHVRAGAMTLSVKVIDAPFQSLIAAIPVRKGDGVAVERADLLGSVKRAKMSTDELHGMTIDVDATGVTFASRLAEKGFAAEDTYDLDTGDVRIKTGINPQYLSDAARALPGETPLALRFGKPLEPIVVTAVGEHLTPTEGSGAIIMPMSMNR